MSANEHHIDEAASRIVGGELVAFPTETVYGLGANALDDRAVAEIFALKGRPQFNPLIVHVGAVEDARLLAEVNGVAGVLMARFWPGPLTLVMKRAKHCPVSLLASAGLDTVAVRMPSHPVAQALLAKAEVPIAAPSANRSGHVSPTTAAHVRDEFGGAVMVLDGGACEIGLESTVLDVTAVPCILRPGSVIREQLEAALGREVLVYKEGGVLAPGMMASHYAPSVPVRLNASEAREGEALLAFGAGSGVLNLSERGDVTEAAANLFAYLRALDDGRFKGIAVMPVPEEGIGVAINDRLRRAATI